jgi:hypothetical protein
MLPLLRDEIDMLDILAPGNYTVTELKEVFDATELKGAGFSVRQLRDDFSLPELRVAKFDMIDLKPEFEIAELRTVYALSEMKDTYSVREFNQNKVPAADVSAHAVSSAPSPRNASHPCVANCMIWRYSRQTRPDVWLSPLCYLTLAVT